MINPHTLFVYLRQFRLSITFHQVIFQHDFVVGVTLAGMVTFIKYHQRKLGQNEFILLRMESIFQDGWCKKENLVLFHEHVELFTSFTFTSYFQGFFLGAINERERA